MRKLTRREIEIRFYADKADQITTAYIGEHRKITYTIRRYDHGGHPFTLHVNEIIQFGYVGMIHSFGKLRHAEQYAHAQIDAVFGIEEESHV